MVKVVDVAISHENERYGRESGGVRWLNVAEIAMGYESEPLVEAYSAGSHAVGAGQLYFQYGGYCYHVKPFGESRGTDARAA